MRKSREKTGNMSTNKVLIHHKMDSLEESPIKGGHTTLAKLALCGKASGRNIHQTTADGARKVIKVPRLGGVGSKVSQHSANIPKRGCSQSPLVSAFKNDGKRTGLRTKKNILENE